MRKLTFHRYLERYVRSLSFGKTNSITKLVKEVPDNPRLKEPLFLFALSFKKVNLLLKASEGCSVCSDYLELANNFNWDDLIKLLEENDMKLNHRYRKVYRSYLSRRNRPDTDNDTRRLMHKKIRKLQEEKGISNYRVYTDLKLNPGNANAFLKNADIARTNMKTTERILEYLESA